MNQHVLWSEWGPGGTSYKKGGLVLITRMPVAGPPANRVAPALGGILRLDAGDAARRCSLLPLPSGLLYLLLAFCARRVFCGLRPALWGCPVSDILVVLWEGKVEAVEPVKFDCLLVALGGAVIKRKLIQILTADQKIMPFHQHKNRGPTEQLELGLEAQLFLPLAWADGCLNCSLPLDLHEPRR